MTRRRKPAQHELRPTIERVVFEHREREAEGKFFSHLQRTRGGWDPLELRLGLRASYRRSRPGYALSNPGYLAVLERNPELDSSLPGRAWLRAVYGRHAMDVTLPGMRETLREQHERAWRNPWTRPRVLRTINAPPASAAAQRDLFEVVGGEAPTS